MGLGAPMNVYIYIKLFLYFTNILKPLIKTTENNGGPCMSKNNAKKVP